MRVSIIFCPNCSWSLLIFHLGCNMFTCKRAMGQLSLPFSQLFKNSVLVTPVTLTVYISMQFYLFHSSWMWCISRTHLCKPHTINASIFAPSSAVCRFICSVAAERHLAAHCFTEWRVWRHLTQQLCLCRCRCITPGSISSFTADQWARPAAEGRVGFGMFFRVFSSAKSCALFLHPSLILR